MKQPEIMKLLAGEWSLLGEQQKEAFKVLIQSWQMGVNSVATSGTSQVCSVAH